MFVFGIENYLGFVIAAIILLTRSVSQGKNAGLISVAGIMSGCVVHVLCAAFGLSMILSSSAAVFMVVQWIGALYLIYLGIKMLLGKNSTFETSPSVHEAMDLMKIYKQGVLTNVLNPKVGLFFLSFLPQFIDPNHVTGPIPFLILGSTFLVTGTIWCLFLSWTAASMTNTLRNNKIAGTLLQKISGMIFIGFGLKIGLGHN